MRVRKLINTSNEILKLKHLNNSETSLPPGVEIENTDIMNLDEVKGKAKVTFDLGEVNEHTKKKLFD